MHGAYLFQSVTVGLSPEGLSAGLM